ncbi:MAG: DUF4258 domain-containing protein [Patescibacteria group bacterium]
MKIVYTRHAKRRMKWRKISEREVRTVLLNPDHQIPYQLDQSVINAFKHIGKRYLQVSYKRRGGAIEIITAVDKSD